jgi:hypothetical protein
MTFVRGVGIGDEGCEVRRVCRVGFGDEGCEGCEGCEDLPGVAAKGSHRVGVMVGRSVGRSNVQTGASHHTHTQQR